MTVRFFAEVLQERGLNPSMVTHPALPSMASRSRAEAVLLKASRSPQERRRDDSAFLR